MNVHMISVMDEEAVGNEALGLMSRASLQVEDRKVSTSSVGSEETSVNSAV